MLKTRPWRESLIPLWAFILWAIRPINYAASKVKWPLRIKRKITEEHYYVIRDLVKTGDIFLTYTKGEFSNLYNPSGDFKHAFKLVDAPNEIYLEAVGEGTGDKRLAHICSSYDRIAIYRYKAMTDAHRFRIAQHWREYLGQPYDFFFEDDDYLKNGHKKALYCFELCVSILQNICGIDRDFLRKETVKDKKVYGPYTFIEDSSFEKVYDSGRV